MSRVVSSIYDLIGGTPMLLTNRFMRKYGLQAKIMAKLELFNPAGSVKDRVAKQMLEQAEQEGLLQPDSVIIEPTSGNTGIGLASIAAAKGYRIILTMPDTMSVERRALLKAYGAELVLTKGALGMRGAIEKAESLAKEHAHSFIPAQFDNPQNPAAHISGTGPEIWEQTGGLVDIFVSAVGTGGTITGVGAYLKKKNPYVRIIAVEPASSPVLSGGVPGPHKIQGIGAGFIPKILDTGIYDEVLQASNEEALSIAKDFAKIEGVLVGVSSGAALWAALTLAKRPENKGKTIVVLLPDTGERYLSLFAQE